MTPGKFQPDLAAILPRAGFDAESLAIITAAESAAPALDDLLQAGNTEAALRLYAYALQRREAVWWASMCVACTAPAGQPHAEIQAREAAERWVRRQDEESRRTAQAAAAHAGNAAPEFWLAMGAFWSGGSMSPAGQPVVPPPAHLTGAAVHGAVGLAAVRQAPQHRAARVTLFLASARDIAGGGAGQIAPEAA